MREIKFKEFKKKYMGGSSKWDFEKFSIVCNKCKSKKIEFNGFLESEGGYYGSHSLEGAIIVKCHDCGNAIRINAESYEFELNEGGEASILKCLKCGEDSRKYEVEGNNGYCDKCRKLMNIKK